jgi:deoxyribose-phosphate aldolase
MTDTVQDTARTALACLDLTSLNDGDDAAAISALCARAAGPAGKPAALCVWLRFVAQAKAAAPAGVRVAAVANFPYGGTDVAAAVADARAIVAAGGDEVDLVLPWHALLADGAAGATGATGAAGAGGAAGAAHAAALVVAVRAACVGRTLKLIIESGDLATPALIHQASLIGLDAGVDFLKTSTGKTTSGATPAAARVMLSAIADHPRGAAVGFKASGGIRTVADAAVYIALVRELLGPHAATPQRLRFGASGLLGDIEAVLAGQGDGNAAPSGQGVGNLAPSGQGAGNPAPASTY